MELRLNGTILPDHGRPMIGQTISHYRITEKLGEGGMGVVYKAEDTKLGRPVALKFLSAHLVSEPEARQRFLREAQAAAALSHPNVCIVYEVDEAQGQTFIVMEFIEGGSLENKVCHGPLNIDEALRIALQVAEGLQEAHEKGVVHRDIKPQNLMLTKRGQVKIMDFGLAHLTHRTTLTKTGTSMGTPVYMSPEQAQGQKIDHRCDIWSLGCVLYEMLAGRPPFVEEHELALLYAILNETPQDVTALRPELPDAISRITSKALAKSPQDRYHAMEALIQDLRQCLAAQSESVQASRERSPRQPGESNQLLPEGERVQVTVVVSSLGGYIDLVEQLNPEEVDQVSQQIHGRAVEIADLHGGAVHQFSADEIVTAFGVATAQEDHFVRAAHAAVALHSALQEVSAAMESKTGCSLWVISGIDTGIVMARRVDEQAQHYQLIGSPMKRAASLARLGKPDEILVSQESQRLLVPFFETEECASLRVECAGELSIPYRLGKDSGPRDRLDAAQRLGLTAYAGRGAELATLRTCLDRALEGEGQFVNVVGEAGLGKSRLLYEFRRRLIRGDIILLQGRCQQRGSNSPFLPFVDVLKRHLLPNGKAPQQDAAQSVVDRIRKIDADLEAYIPVTLHLLSLQSDVYPMPQHTDGANMRLAVIEALSAIFTLSTQHGPVVVLLEDWHWSDKASQDALNQLAELIPAYRLLAVVTSRPEAPQDWSGLPHHTLIRLRPLKQASSLTLAKSVVSAEQFPEDLAATLYERTGGNPFFLEEICRSLRENGTMIVEGGRASLTCSISKLEWPGSVQAVIRSRLNQLERESRRVLRMASVIGREFGQALLKKLVGAVDLVRTLNSLKAAGLIQQTRVLPEPTYRFKHALIQDVVYDSLLQHQQKSLHEQAGESIEALAGHDAAEKHAEVLAHHFSQAANWPKAIRYGRDVAQRNSRINLFVESLEMLERVDSWLQKVPEDDECRTVLRQVLLDQERLCEALGQPARQQELINRLLSILTPSGDSAELAETYIRQGDFCAVRGRFKEGQAALQEALRISRAVSMTDLEMRALRSVSHSYSRQGRYDEGMAILEDLIARDRKAGSTRELLIDINSMCVLLARLGRFSRAMGYAAEVLESSEAQACEGLWVPFHYTVGEIYRRMGDDAKALHYYERNMELGLGTLKAWGFWKPAITLVAMSNVHLRGGNLEESLRRASEAVEFSRKSRQADALATAHRQMSAVLLSLDRHSEALSHIRAAGVAYAGLEEQENVAVMHRLEATILERQGDLSGAMASWERTRQLEQRCANAAGEIEALKGLGRIARKRGLPEAEALQYYLAALKLAELVGEGAKLCDLHNTIGILAWQQGEYQIALAHYQQALQICRDRGDHIHEGLMRNSVGVTLHKLGRYQEAKVMLENALGLHRENEKRLLEGHALAALGDIHFDLENFDQSIARYEESLRIRREIADLRGEGWMLHHLARVYVTRRQPTIAQELLAQASKIAHNHDIEDLAKACRELLSS